jgi:hypothetical protein
VFLGGAAALPLLAETVLLQTFDTDLAETSNETDDDAFLSDVDLERIKIASRFVDDEAVSLFEQWRELDLVLRA